MNIYFFYDRIFNPKMVSDIGGSITEQFKGTINNIYRKQPKKQALGDLSLKRSLGIAYPNSNTQKSFSFDKHLLF